MTNAPMTEEDRPMKLIIAAATLATALVAASAAQAGQVNRNVTVYGPHGVSTHSGQRVCYDGVCTYAGSTTGAYGHTTSRSATTTQIDDGVYQRSVTGVGPHGGVWSRSGTVTVSR